jgi:hypothetical protein
MCTGLWTEKLASRRFSQYAGAFPTTCCGQKATASRFFFSPFFKKEKKKKIFTATPQEDPEVSLCCLSYI